MEIGGLQKTTLIDYPGKVACTVFTIGCNFRCPFCYSSELVLPEKTKKQQRISDQDFFNFLEERRGLLEGVCVCGGEPTVHENLPEFIKKIKDLGFYIKLDTNGSNPGMLKELIEENLIDYVAMDIKAPLELKSQASNPKFQKDPKRQIPKYEQMTGIKVNLKDIKKSIEILKQAKVEFEFRTTVAPGLTKDDIFKMADYISGENVRYFLQEFNSQKEVINPEILNLPVLKEEDIKKIIEEIKPRFKTCKLR